MKKIFSILQLVLLANFIVGQSNTGNAPVFDKFLSQQAGNQIIGLLPGNASGWLLKGNTGTNPATNFIGTTDTAKIIFKWNGIWAGTIDPKDSNISLGLYGLQSTYTATYCAGVPVNIAKCGIGNAAFGITALKNNTYGYYNCAFGWRSLLYNTSGYENTAMGISALQNTTTGASNTSVGNVALALNTTGGFNTAIGHNAMRGYTAGTGSYNTAIGTYAIYNSGATPYGNFAAGDSAMFYIENGYNNIAIGTQALLGYSLSTTEYPKECIAIGRMAMNNAKKNAFNIAIGDSALFADSISSFNTAIGYKSMSQPFYSGRTYSMTGNVALGNNALRTDTASYNTAIGNQSMLSNTLGTFNTAVGNNALASNAVGSSNTAIGDNALDKTKKGLNTAIGDSAMYANVKGYYNVAAGYAAGYNNINGYKDIAIGSNTIFSAIGNINAMVLGGFDTSAGSNTAVLDNAQQSIYTHGSHNLYYNGGYNSGSAGNLLISEGSNASPQWLANGSSGQVLTISGGVPAWATSAVLTVQASSVTSGTITVSQGINVLILNGGGTNSTVTINLPLSPVQGQVFGIAGNTTFSTPTFASTGNTFANAPTAITAGTAIRFILYGNVWYNL